MRLKKLTAFPDKGSVRPLMMSQDHVNCWNGGLTGAPVGLQASDVRPNGSRTPIFERIIPQPKANGMQDADFNTILVDNPRRFFTSLAKEAAALFPCRARRLRRSPAVDRPP